MQSSYLSSRQILLSRFLWTALVLFTVYVAIRGHPDVSQWYRQGATRWLHGLFLYNTAELAVHGSHSVAGTGFIYFPQAAILFTPFTLLPPVLSRIVWRLFLIVLLMISTRSLNRILIRRFPEYNPVWTSVIMIAAGVSSTITGQMNIVLFFTTLMASICIAQERWRTAAFFLVLGICAKPTAIVMLLLAAGGYRQMRLPLLTGMAVAFLIPFGMQNSHYVMMQYHGVAGMLHAANEYGVDSGRWAQLFGAWSQASGYHVPDNIQFWLRILFALVTLWGLRTLRAQNTGKKNPEENSAFYLFALATIYLMLFNPRTESNDYIQMAPVFIAGVALCRTGILSWCGRSFFLLMLAGITFDRFFSQLIIPGSHNWISPVCTVLTLLAGLAVFAHTKVIAYVTGPGYRKNLLPLLQLTQLQK